MSSSVSMTAAMLECDQGTVVSYYKCDYNLFRETCTNFASTFMLHDRRASTLTRHSWAKNINIIGVTSLMMMDRYGCLVEWRRDPTQGCGLVSSLETTELASSYFR
eukprot:Lithocolla_globosa_v1_NODE_1653_length_2417_cov_24.680779.p2 type:complete len:106 gc:universal NODE_1653_length_2417_cov_24.680779:681-364(-)